MQRTSVGDFLEGGGWHLWSFLKVWQSFRGEPPHTIASCANDVVETLAAAGVDMDAEATTSWNPSIKNKMPLHHNTS
eukprot:2188823-Amphidinium_carterae.1